MCNKQSRKGDGRVAFLAHINTFWELLNAGHTQRSIYDDHASVLGISYSQFSRYVGKYLPVKEGDHKHQIKQATGGTPQATPVTSIGQKPSKPVPFAYDPNSGNDRDLI